MADDGIVGGGDTPTGEPPAATRRSSAARPEAPIRHHGAHAGPARGVEDLPRRSPRLLRLAALAAAGRGRHRLARRIRLRHRLPARRREHPALPAALPRLGNRMGLCALPGQHGDLPRHPATRRQPNRHPRTSPRLRHRPLPRLPDRLDQPPDGLTRCCTSSQWPGRNLRLCSGGSQASRCPRNPMLPRMTDTAYPVRVTGRLDSPLSRWLWLVKWVLAIPHYIVLGLLWIVYAVISVIAFFAILFTGRYPRSLFDFNVGVLRWHWRVTYYVFNVWGTDRYPPFTLADVPDYPARFDVVYPERLSRLLVLVKWWLLAIPQYLIVGLLAGGGSYVATQTGHGNWASWNPGGGLIGLLALIAVIVLAVTGRYPQGLFDLLIGLNRWVLRVAAYAGLMTDAYPPFRLDMGGGEPADGPLRPELGSPGSESVHPEALAPGSTSSQPVGAEPDAPVEPGGRGLTAGNIAAIVIGALLVVTGLGLAGGGAAVGWLNSHRDRDGFLTTGTDQVATPTVALTTERIDLAVGSQDWLYNQDRFGTIRIHATSTTGAPVFVGVSPPADVGRYLGSGAHDKIASLSLRPFRVTCQRLPRATALRSG